MKVWLTTDNHFFHKNLVLRGHRPESHHELQIKYWKEMVNPSDIIFCLGDFSLGSTKETIELIQELPGRKVLVLGNHDSHSALWYMRNGFEFAATGILYRNIWFTHEPDSTLPDGADINVHGHIHDTPPERHQHTPQPWHKLLAIEHTAYKPVELNKWLVNR